MWYLLVLSFTHAIVDLSSGAIVALLPFFREQYSLNYTMVGNIMLWSSLTFSISQPVFGLISDRSEKRWLLPASLALGGIGVAATGWMDSYGLVLVAVVACTLGTAAFHPEGAHAAHHLGGRHRARAMAIYSVGGNIGYGLGPLYGAFLVSLGDGMRGTAWAAVIPVLFALVLVRMLPRWQQFEQKASAARTENPAQTNWRGMALITLVVILRSIIHLGVAAFVPFFWTDTLGNDPATAKYVQLIYLMSGVAGTLLGAPLADRWGTKRMLMLTAAALLPLQFALPLLSGWVLLVCLFVAGFVLVSTFAVTLVMTQDYMPRRLGLASGINLGLAFGMGGVGALLLGMLADRWGVIAVLWTCAALVIPTFLVSTLLPPVGREERTTPLAASK